MALIQTYVEEIRTQTGEVPVVVENQGGFVVIVQGWHFHPIDCGPEYQCEQEFIFTGTTRGEAIERAVEHLPLARRGRACTETSCKNLNYGIGPPTDRYAGKAEKQLVREIRKLTGKEPVITYLPTGEVLLAVQPCEYTGSRVFEGTTAARAAKQFLGAWEDGRAGFNWPD